LSVTANPLQRMAGDIEKAFKSLIKSGRPDITDENGKTLVPKLYVDLFSNNYVLNQVLDDNHTLLKGRRGTGKSTVFLKAENELSNSKGNFAIYINLQSCYEEVKTANADDSNEMLTRYLTYKNFLTEILRSMQKRFSNFFSSDSAFSELFTDIEAGKYIDADFQRSIQITHSKSVSSKASISVGAATNGGTISAIAANSTQNLHNDTYTLNEIRIFSIHDILRRMIELLNRHGVTRAYLFLDDFSELSQESQRVVVDSLIAPIIASYNDKFKIKLAGYPGRIYLGNIDTTKLPVQSLDFYNAFESTSSTYNDVEELSVSYIERTLAKRLEVYTHGRLSLSDIFETSGSVTVRDYLQRLFYCTAGIPRALGFVLTYCYLSSINAGNRITLTNIDNATAKYFEENVLADFVNDARFKQSFYDDKDLLDQLAQKNLMDKLADQLFAIKRDAVDAYSKGKTVKKIFATTLEMYKRGPTYWLPTSHFYVNKATEQLLNTLELYFIVSKFNEGSSREPGQRTSIYGLNYGLCLHRKIDYGRPQFRRTYDWWRQEEFDFNEHITAVLSSIEVVKCTACDKEYFEVEYKIYTQYHKCFKCGSDHTVIKVNKLASKFERKLAEWRDKKLPNHHVDILRTLYNNRNVELSAHEIGMQIDRHHLSVTNAMRTLNDQHFVSVEERDKRYYRISDVAVYRFFSDEVEQI